MQNNVIALVDFDAGFEQLGVVRVLNRKGGRGIAVRRQQQTHIDAAPSRTDQGSLFLSRRYEVCSRDPGFLFCSANGRQHCDVVAGGHATWAAANDAYNLLAMRPRLTNSCLVGDGCAVLLTPVLFEKFLKVYDYGSGDLNIDVPP